MRRGNYLTLLFSVLVLMLPFATLSQQNKSDLDAALFQAIRQGDLVQAKTLLQQGVNPNTRDDDMTALMRAVSYRNKEMITLLLDHGADIHARVADSDFPTALAQAIYLPDLSIARLLFARKASLAEAEEVMIYSALMGHDSVLEFFLGQGANVDSTVRKNPTTPLMAAAMIRRKSTVRLLLAHGANVNKRGRKGSTILISTIIYNIGSKYRGDLIAVMKMLLAKGAKVALKDEEGNTALKMALKYKLNDIAALLRKAGAKE